MKYLISFIVVFVMIYLFYLFFIVLRKEQVKKFKNNTFLRYLVRVYKLDIKKLDLKKMANIIGLTNGFIIALTYVIVLFIDGFNRQMFMAMGVFILLELTIYHIIGKILQRRDKNGL